MGVCLDLSDDISGIEGFQWVISEATHAFRD